MELIKRDVQDWERHFRRPPPGQSWWYTYSDIKEKAAEDTAQSALSLKAELSEISAVREENIAEIRRGRPDPNTRKRLPRPTVSNWKKGPVFNVKKMKTPNHKLPGKASAIVQAPPGFVDQIKRQQQAQTRPAPSRPANAARRPDQGRGTGPPSINKEDLTERESRLRAAMASQGTSSSRLSPSEASQATGRPIIRVPTRPPSSVTLSSRAVVNYTPEKSQPKKQTSSAASLKRLRIDDSEDDNSDRRKKRFAERENDEDTSDHNSTTTSESTIRQACQNDTVDKLRQQQKSSRLSPQTRPNATDRHTAANTNSQTNPKRSASNNDQKTDMERQRQGEESTQHRQISTTLKDNQASANGVSQTKRPLFSTVRRTASPLVNSSPRKKRPIAA